MAAPFGLLFCVMNTEYALVRAGDEISDNGATTDEAGCRIRQVWLDLVMEWVGVLGGLVIASISALVAYLARRDAKQAHVDAKREGVK